MEEEKSYLGESTGSEEVCGVRTTREPLSVEARKNRGRQLDYLLERTGFGTYHVFLLIGESLQKTKNNT